ncbi:MAG: hypothetical protein LBR81_03190 [Prevotellaceae bacterium]|jgi:hypothetical protein|nr:hypothetical protein [Prevotellaceae bacterium]
MINTKKTGLLLAVFCIFLFIQPICTQTGNSKIPVISAKDFYTGLKNKSLKFSYNQEIIITGVLKDTGSSLIYNSSYLLISDKKDGGVFVKAVLADKNKRSEYKNGQNIQIYCRFYEEREHVVVVKNAKNN